MFQERNTLIAELLTGTLENCRIGVIAQAFPEINIATVVNTIRKKLDRNLYVSVVGYEIENQQLNGITIETTIEKSIEWRNKRQYSRSILVFVRGDVSKLHSLREFDTVTSRDLSLFLLKKAEYLSDNDPQKAFWKAMQNEAATFPLAMVEKFVDAVHRQRKDMDAIPNNLWHLGLLRDEQILSRIQKPSERLRRNLAIIEEMGQLSQNSRRRMGAVLSRARG
ncbi:MAG TPA: hypothetical protein PK263_03470, partial [bacterium]|nr:hypothetical protein [bacterium]